MRRSGKTTAFILAGILAAAELGNVGFTAYAADITGISEESVSGEDQGESLTPGSSEGSIEVSTDEISEEITEEIPEELSGEISEEVSEEISKDGAAPAEGSYDGIYYESADADTDAMISLEGASQVQLPAGVTQEMCRASYWNDKTVASGIGSDRVLITGDEIKTLNAATLANNAANMNDIEKMAAADAEYNADSLKESLAAGTTPHATKSIYVDGQLVDKNAYYADIAEAIRNTGFTGSGRKSLYAVAVRRTTVNNIPVSAYIGYSATDSDDEKVNSALNVNEPFVIRQKATVLDEDFYWGYSDNCTGWVAAADLAVCSSTAEWLDAWKTDIGADDFIVVTQNQIRLEPSVYKPELSEVKLTFATVLKTVPEDKIPDSVAERGPWNNYVVYLPGRDEDGGYVKHIAFISQHYEVSEGYLTMTQEELMRVAFNNIGDRYGWGGMLDSMDCSMFTRNVYRCFGLRLPRNTTWQQEIPERKIDLSALGDDEKLAAISRMPSGTLLYFPGHTMIYTGTVKTDGQEMAYVISDTGSLSDSTGELNVRSMYSILLTPLSVRRSGNRGTWLHNVSAAVLPVSGSCFSRVAANITTVQPPEPENILRVPAAEGQTYASSLDTLPLETFLGSTQGIYISFANVEGSGVQELRATVIKGTKVTTKAPVTSVHYNKGVASYTKKKSTNLACVTLKKTGTVTFEMADGKSYSVNFTVESPKAREKAVKALIKAAKTDPDGTLNLDAKTLFGTSIDSGSLKIVSQKKKNGASVFGNVFTLNAKTKNSVKVRYKYLEKKYYITLTVK